MKARVFTLTLLVVAAYSHLCRTAPPLTVLSSFDPVSRTIGERTGTDRPFPDNYGLARTAMERVDASLYRIYERPRARPIALQLFYTKTRYENNRITIYSNINCLYGTYPIVSPETFRFADGTTARLLHLTRGQETAVVLYWFQSVETATPDVVPFILRQYRRDLFGQRSDALLAALAIEGVPTPEELAEMKALAGRIRAELADWLARQKIAE